MCEEEEEDGSIHVCLNGVRVCALCLRRIVYAAKSFSRDSGASGQCG